jgi:hypothetical protein
MPITTPQMEDAALAQSQAAQLDPNNLAKANVATASGQLGSILSSGSPLMQQAATQGNQSAASRGLLNSSMGIQAAQNAMIQNAAPIAQADANAMNQNSQFNAGATNQALNQNTQNMQATNQFNTQQQNAMSTWNAGQQNEASLRSLDINSRETLANIEANYKTLMQTNSSASGMYEQMLKNLADISGSADMDAGAKQSAINNQLTYLRTGMSMLQNMSGVSGLITF